MKLIDYFNIAQIILSIALIVAIILQSKQAGLGGLSGADTGGVFRARRGIERTLFQITIVLAAAFFIVAVASLMVGQ